ncbi:hypothetical protein ABZ723_16100 [Streptomyces sp. NPDC006700]
MSPVPATAATADCPAVPASLGAPRASGTDGRPPAAAVEAVAEGRSL